MALAASCRAYRWAALASPKRREWGRGCGGLRDRPSRMNPKLAPHRPVPGPKGPQPSEYGLPPRTYDPLPYAIPQDATARFKAWSDIADSLTEALRQVTPASSHDYSSFTSQFAHATRPR